MFKGFLVLELDFPGPDGKESVCSTGDPGSIPRLGRSPGEGKGYPLQYSCLGNPMAGYSPWGHYVASHLSDHFSRKLVFRAFLVLESGSYFSQSSS